MTAQSPSRSTRSTRATVPASVWASGPGPIDPQDRWPGLIISRAVHEFSDPDDRVLLVRWPVPTTRGPLAAVPPDTGAALAVIEGLGRHGWLETGAPGPIRSAELVLASLHPAGTDPVAAADAIAELAMDRLTEGGLLVVLARCGHSADGVLLDPAGSVVAAAHAADLLYLQHLIAVPVTGTTIPQQDPPAPEHGAHVLTHTDLFVFLKPRSDAAQ